MRIPPHAKYEIIYEMTKQNGNRLSVSTLCEIAGVSRSGYYNYLSTEDVRSKREEQDRKDFQKILEAYSFRGYNKGARSIYMRLLHIHHTRGLHKVWDSLERTSAAFIPALCQ